MPSARQSSTNQSCMATNGVAVAREKEEEEQEELWWLPNLGLALIHCSTVGPALYSAVQWIQHYTVQYSGLHARGILVVQCSAVQCRGRGILFEQQSS